MSSACDPRLWVYICGRPAVEAGDVVVGKGDLPGRQGRRLWVYLSLHQRGPVGRVELAEAIWGDDIPDAWDTILNALVSWLRSALAPLAELAPALRSAASQGAIRWRFPPDRSSTGNGPATQSTRRIVSFSAAIWAER